MNGIFVDRDIRALIEDGAITAHPDLEDRQIQPASLDLRLGEQGWRIRSGFLPESTSVHDKLEELVMYPIDASRGAILEKGQVYLFLLAESLALPPGVGARSNPKSSIGRLDIFTRVITDRHRRFDDIRPGYAGPLYVEVVPRSFTVRVRSGDKLNQLRLFRGESEIRDADLRRLYLEHQLLYDDEGNPCLIQDAVFDSGLYMRVSLASSRGDGIVGYRAKRFSPIVDLSLTSRYTIADFWEPIRGATRSMILEPEEFYIFRSKERVRVPPCTAAEMMPYDVGVGELRTNYAGFFDNGFGYGRCGDLPGTAAVLEVRPHDVPFVIEDNQVLFKLKFFRATREPLRLYGDPSLASSYQGQALRLSKHFAQDPADDASPHRRAVPDEREDQASL